MTYEDLPRFYSPRVKDVLKENISLEDKAFKIFRIDRDFAARETNGFFNPTKTEKEILEILQECGK